MRCPLEDTYRGTVQASGAGALHMLTKSPDIVHYSREKVAGGTLHTYERKLYPHNKAESRERRRWKQVWGPILSQS